MQTSSAYPRYSYPPSVLLALIRDGLLQRPRNFRKDALRCIANLRPPLRIIGDHYIPQRGGYVITLNHYYRPGFAAQWSALAISAAVPAYVHWIMTDELTFPGSRIAPLGRPVSHFILGRVARIYGFTPMPPMPPRARDVERRASVVRRALRYAHQASESVIAIAPEGGDQPGGRLCTPPSGSGRFGLLLAAAGMRFLPVGVYECDGALSLNFGEPYELNIPRVDSTLERDRLAAFAVMAHIAPLLPAELRGEFSGAH